MSIKFLCTSSDHNAKKATGAHFRIMGYPFPTPYEIAPQHGGSKTQVTFQRSLIAGHCFTFLKVTQNPQFGGVLDRRCKCGSQHGLHCRVFPNGQLSIYQSNQIYGFSCPAFETGTT